MAVANFYLHAQTLMKRPIKPELIYVASAADLAVVTLFVLMDGGFKSPLYTFYFPAVMAFAVVFPTEITTLYTVATAMCYTLICLFNPAMSALAGTDASKNMQTLVARVVILVAMAVCGNVYLRIERTRRNAAAKTHSDLLSEISNHGSL
jgi:hypothetical protein